MKKIWMVLKKLGKKEEGSEMAEWGVVAALVIIGAAAIWGTLGTNIVTVITDLAGKIKVP